MTEMSAATASRRAVWTMVRRVAEAPARVGAMAFEGDVDEVVLDVDDLDVAAVGLQEGADAGVDGGLDLLGELEGGDGLRGGVGGRGGGGVGGGRGGLAPDVVEDVLEAAGGVAAEGAHAAGLEGGGDFVEGMEVQLLDLAAEVGLGEVEALADDAAFVLFLVEGRGGGVGGGEGLGGDAAAAGPVGDGGLEGLGAHDGAVDLLLGEAVEELDDVVVGDGEGLRRGEVLAFDEAAEGLGGGDGGGAAEGEVAGLDDDVLEGVGRVAADAEGELEGVAADDGAVLADAVGVLDLAEVGAGLALDGVEEELLGLFGIFPGHGGILWGVGGGGVTSCGGRTRRRSRRSRRKRRGCVRRRSWRGSGRACSRFHRNRSP